MVDYVKYPLLLAGPILRRTEARSVSVWLACSMSFKASLSLWQDAVDTGPGIELVSAPNSLYTSGPATASIRLGENLHVLLVTLDIAASETPLVPEVLYSYNVTIEYEDGGVSKREDLKSLSLLKDAAIDGRPNLALGYEQDFLPSFSLCPMQLTDLKILYGSCRRPHKGLSDGLAWVDDFIKRDRTNPVTRPHQLLLGGDQIYADDVSDVMLSMMMDSAKNLIGMNDTKATIESASIFNQLLPLEKKQVPYGLRDSLIQDDAKMTSHAGKSHLIGFGEFCAMYLYVWSNACWPRLDQFPSVATMMDYNFIDDMPKEMVGEGEKDQLWKLHALGGLDDAHASAYIGKTLSASDRTKLADFIKEEKRQHEIALQKDIDVIKRFYSTLDRVRRAMANVPTYMIFDDHEVTDDWNLNPIWKDRVYTAPLGRTIIRNALTSYCVFQAWGNDPKQFSKAGANKSLFELIPQMFKPASSPGGELAQGPDADTCASIDDLIGLSGEISKIKWHFEAPGSRHKVVAIDNRTQRDYVTRFGPPSNLSKKALKEQIPAAPLQSGIELLILIAPLQVLGPPIFDELFGPLSYKMFDAFSYAKLNKHQGTAGMPGTNPDAIEAWAFDPKTLESLLARLEPYRKVVLLSGDVHYGSSQVMSYWKKGVAEPARFAQFTSSGMLNTMPSYVQIADRSLGFLQRMLRADIGAERVGWKNNSAEPLLIADKSKLVPVLNAKLNEKPVMVPTHGWVEGTKLNPDNPVDWSWRVTPILDHRADTERPQGAQPLPLNGNANQDIDNNADGYRKLMRRHVAQMDKLNNSRQILFANNLGLLRFEQQNGNLVAFNELYTVFPFDLPHYKEAELYTHHSAQLTGVSEKRPEDVFA